MNFYSINQVEVEREDSVFLALESITEVEEKAFSIQETERRYKPGNPYTRLDLVY